ncbi:hypothetical protein EDB82DRAFT_503323 [Fusarium venenatum]|uniref:uncharacterized protein n=1 Tax=Fusarium venenatum TaxID=56646 RepID=UPI001D7B1100|nr:hypothetical protein EDB82DRAFT_503323 [Fusarium venenatum]
MATPYLKNSLQADCHQSLSQSIPQELLDSLNEPLEDFGSNLDYLYDFVPENDEVHTQNFPELPPADGFEDFIDPALQNEESSDISTLQGQSRYHDYPTYNTNKPLLFQSPDGPFMALRPQSTQPSQAQPELFALPQDLNPYAPLYPHYQFQSQYPDAGINGHQGALSIPQYPPVYDQKPAPGICRNCGCVAHYPPCLLQPLAHAKPAQSIPAQVSQPERRKWAPKTRWMDEDEESDECQEIPAKKGRKNVSRLVSRVAKSKTTRVKKKVQKDGSTNIFPYPPFGELLEWRTADDCHISYLSAGQFDDELLFTAKELRDYLEQCPRELKIWLQNSPSKCKGRHIDADVKCRYSECPAKYGTILHGWHRVAFDEFPERTSTGIKDPYKMAGVMHLWCFEQCIDPLEPIEKQILLPDDREFEHETSNRMAITRDDYKLVIEGAIRPWIRERRRVGVTQAPYARHEDTLAWALCNFHVKHQNGSRDKTRQKRNEDKPDDEKKSMDLIMGDLAEYHKRAELTKSRKGNKGGIIQSNSFASKPVNPPQVGRQSPERKEIAENVPEDRVQDVIEAAPYELAPLSEDEMFELLKEFNQTGDTAARPITPQSLGTEVPMRVSCPPAETATMSNHPLADQAKVSPAMIQDSITIPAPVVFQAGGSPLGTGSLFGSTTGSVLSTGSRKRSREEEAVGTPDAKKRRQYPPDPISVQVGDSPIGTRSLFGSPTGSVASSTRSRKRSREEEAVDAPEAKRRPPPTWSTGPPRRRSRYSLPKRSPARRGSGPLRKRISV